MKKGFTLIELLAVIVILAIVLAIAIPQIEGIIENSRINVLKKNEEILIKATKSYFVSNKTNPPVNIGDTIQVTMDVLKEQNLIKPVISPYDNNIECNGYVVITKIGVGDYEYTPYLNCVNDIGSSVEDGLIAHYTFDDFQEPTGNLIPNSPTNTYPTVGNEHRTYNTNQYYSNVDFSIGTIGSVSNNIVTLSAVDHPIYTYDVLNPATSGGGVTAGTHYFIKKHSSNSFSLHQYNNVQDGSLGFGVYDSIDNDERISISASGFPTMWHGDAHLPNSALVKEIIPNGFNYMGRKHDCIRLHTEHKPDGSVDGMAYGVYPQVVAGNTYSFSFYYRAVNEESVGTNITLGLWTGCGWSGDNIDKEVTSTDWQKYELTAVAPNSGSTNLYFWITKGATIDISEIQCEEKDYATEFTINSREGIVKDYSGNGNYATLESNSTPKWVDEAKVGNGAYEFDGITTYIDIPDDIVPVSEIRKKGITYVAWIKPYAIGEQRIVGQQISTGYSDYSSGGLGITTIGKPQMIAYSDANPAAYINVVGTTVLEEDNWYYLVGTFDSSDNKLRIYVNGELEGTPGSVGTFSRLYTNAENRIGHKNHSDENYFHHFDGIIDDVRIYNRALNEEEIKQMYNISK